MYVHIGYAHKHSCTYLHSIILNNMRHIKMIQISVKVNTIIKVSIYLAKIIKKLARINPYQKILINVHKK